MENFCNMYVGSYCNKMMRGVKRAHEGFANIFDLRGPVFACFVASNTAQYGGMSYDGIRVSIRVIYRANKALTIEHPWCKTKRQEKKKFCNLYGREIRWQSALYKALLKKGVMPAKAESYVNQQMCLFLNEQCFSDHINSVTDGELKKLTTKERKQ